MVASGPVLFARLHGFAHELEANVRIGIAADDRPVDDDVIGVDRHGVLAVLRARPRSRPHRRLAVFCVIVPRRAGGLAAARLQNETVYEPARMMRRGELGRRRIMIEIVTGVGEGRRRQQRRQGEGGHEPFHNESPTATSPLTLRDRSIGALGYSSWHMWVMRACVP